MFSAAVFHGSNHGEVATIETAYRTLIPLLGWGAAGVFLVALIASGISSSAVGTMAGQVMMQGFVAFRIPVAVRRLVTMAPAFVVVALGADTTFALVLSQVVLSIALPVPMVTLLLLTRRRDIMGAYANGAILSGVAVLATAIILVLNLVLVLSVLGLPIPFLAS